MEKPSEKNLQMSYMSTGSYLLLSKSLDSGATRKGGRWTVRLVGHIDGAWGPLHVGHMWE